MTIERQDIGGIDRLWATERNDFIGFTVHSVNRFEFEVARVIVSGNGYHFLELFVRYQNMPEHWAKPEQVHFDESEMAAAILTDIKPTLDEIFPKTSSIMCRCGERIAFPLVVGRQDMERIEWLIKELRKFLDELAPSGEVFARQLAAKLEKALKSHNLHLTKNRTLLKVLDREEGTENGH